MQQAKKKQRAQASGSARGNLTLAQAYWDRFESIDELDELDLDDAEDVKAVGNVPKIAMPLLASAEANKQVLNDEIEDIDSDDEYAMAAHQMQQQANANRQKVPGLSLAGLGAPTHFTMQQPDMSLPTKPGVPSLNMPSLGGPQAPGIPSLGLRGDVENSGRLSSKRDGIGRLNLAKAHAIQQDLLNKQEGFKKPGVKDLDEEQPAPKGGLGLNLGGVKKPGGFNLPVGGTQEGAPPVHRRGGDLDAQRGGNLAIPSNDNAEMQAQIDEEFDYKGTSRK